VDCEAGVYIDFDDLFSAALLQDWQCRACTVLRASVYSTVAAVSDKITVGASHYASSNSSSNECSATTTSTATTSQSDSSEKLAQVLKRWLRRQLKTVYVKKPSPFEYAVYLKNTEIAELLCTLMPMQVGTLLNPNPQPQPQPKYFCCLKLFVHSCLDLIPNSLFFCSLHLVLIHSSHFTPLHFSLFFLIRFTSVPFHQPLS